MYFKSALSGGFRFLGFLSCFVLVFFLPRLIFPPVPRQRTHIKTINIQV